MRLAISGTKSEIQLIIIISVIMRTVFEVENAIRASFKLIVVVGPTGTVAGEADLTLPGVFAGGGLLVGLR